MDSFSKSCLLLLLRNRSLPAAFHVDSNLSMLEKRVSDKMLGLTFGSGCTGDRTSGGATLLQILSPSYYRRPQGGTVQYLWSTTYLHSTPPCPSAKTLPKQPIIRLESSLGFTPCSSLIGQLQPTGGYCRPSPVSRVGRNRRLPSARCGIVPQRSPSSGGLVMTMKVPQGLGKKKRIEACCCSCMRQTHLSFLFNFLS
ncbi:hypothetical protein BR93DRAFT_609980 [Coniochaeta sp. PMI_546]|nr:hypothetical protein BR93DRAFT_609980 [Coniochaeta sp. PMI_546]